MNSFCDKWKYCDILHISSSGRVIVSCNGQIAFLGVWVWWTELHTSKAITGLEANLHDKWQVIQRVGIKNSIPSSSWQHFLVPRTTESISFSQPHLSREKIKHSFFTPWAALLIILYRRWVNNWDNGAGMCETDWFRMLFRLWFRKYSKFSVLIAISIRNSLIQYFWFWFRIGIYYFKTFGFDFEIKCLFFWFFCEPLTIIGHWEWKIIAIMTS